MGLVDYDSDTDTGTLSDGGTSTKNTGQPTPTTSSSTATTGKKTFQKLVDPANPGKIIVSLPSSGDDKDDSAAVEERPAKRAKVGGGGSRFSGFGSLLPPPKTGATAAVATGASSGSSGGLLSSAGSGAPRPGIHFKTSGAVAFRRPGDVHDGDGTFHDDGSAFTGHENVSGVSESNTDTHNSSSKFKGGSLSLALPPPKMPSVAPGQKAAADVQLTGRATMFVPLSVARKLGKKKATTGVKAAAAPGGQTTLPAVATAAENGAKLSTAVQAAQEPPANRPAKKKVSLFSLGTEAADGDDDAAVSGVADASSEYQPLFTADAATSSTPGYNDAAGADSAGAFPQQESVSSYTEMSSAVDPASIGALADDLRLSAKDQRALFGRHGGTAVAAKQVIATFDMDAEYRRNEALRQASATDVQQQAHNPVRAIQPGKHSLRQLVNSVHAQRDALEENFAKNRATQRESGGKYGWR